MCAPACACGERVSLCRVCVCAGVCMYVCAGVCACLDVTQCGAPAQLWRRGCCSGVRREERECGRERVVEESRRGRGARGAPAPESLQLVEAREGWRRRRLTKFI